MTDMNWDVGNDGWENHFSPENDSEDDGSSRQNLICSVADFHGIDTTTTVDSKLPKQHQLVANS